MAGDSLWHYFLFITDVSGRRLFGSQTLVAKPSSLPCLDNTSAGKKETRGLRATPEPFFAMAIVC